MSFDSCITATLTLLFSITTPSSVSLLPIPFALSCRPLNVLSSLFLYVGGTGVGGGEGVGGEVSSWQIAYRSSQQLFEHARVRLLLFSTTRSVVKSVKISVVEIAKRTN